MIFADKLIQLRKKNGWSQEELAEKIDVSRQSVSKWEGAQAIPDYDKMIKLSNLFGVSIDYLLKDNIESEEFIEPIDEIKKTRVVTMQEASEFIKAKASISKAIAGSIFLFIISPITLILLVVLSENPSNNISQTLASSLGMIILLLLVAIGVAIICICGSKTVRFNYLEKEIFETEYGVNGMVKDKKEKYRDTYTRNNVIGTVICILAIVPLFLGNLLNETNDAFMVSMLAITLFLVAIGVTFFTNAGIIWGSFEKLLQEGDYTINKKKMSSVASTISTVYWLVVVAIYLVVSFTQKNWEYSWIIFAVAGVLYPAIILLINLFDKKSK